jgi:hypothetical protein
MGLAFAALMLPIRAIQGLFALIVLAVLAYGKFLPILGHGQLLIETPQLPVIGLGGGHLPRSTS